MYRSTVILLAVSVLFCEFSTPTSEAAPSAYDDILRAESQAGRFSGVVLIRVGDVDEYFGNFGHAVREFEVPFKRDTRFKFHSLTKPFLSAAVYRLFAEGQLDRDALICQYLEPCPKGWEQVTIRELLNHSSGIPDLSGEFLDRWKGSLGETYHAVVRSAEDLALQTEPGEVFRYSNGGYVLLARILEVVTGTPVNEAMNELVFRPMGLSGAGMEQSPDLEVAGWYNGSVEVQRLANGYNGSPEEVRTAYSPMYTIPGAGAAYGTVDDLDRFARELFEGSFLPKPLVEQLLTIDENLGVPYADGWVVRARAGQPTYRHDGGNNGFVSSLEYYPRQRMTVIVLSNFGFTDIGSIRKKLGLAALEKLGVDIEE